MRARAVHTAWGLPNHGGGEAWATLWAWRGEFLVQEKRCAPHPLPSSSTKPADRSQIEQIFDESLARPEQIHGGFQSSPASIIGSLLNKVNQRLPELPSTGSSGKPLEHADHFRLGSSSGYACPFRQPPLNIVEGARMIPQLTYSQQF